MRRPSVVSLVLYLAALALLVVISISAYRSEAPWVALLATLACLASEQAAKRAKADRR